MYLPSSIPSRSFCGPNGSTRWIALLAAVASMLAPGQSRIAALQTNHRRAVERQAPNLQHHKEVHTSGSVSSRVDHKALSQGTNKLLERADLDRSAIYSANPPRCVKSDFERPRRRRRFVPHKKKWRYTDLSWRLRDPFNLFKFKSDLNLVREVIKEGFRLWARATRGALELRDISEGASAVTPTPDLDIFFALKDHGDHEPFDGTGGIVAHTGYPMEGKVHFDGAEFWTLNSDTGIDFRYVALHEIGHALGLRHSHHNDSVMFPIYRRAGGVGELGLHRDDVRGIRYLYPLPKRRRLRFRSLKERRKIPGGYAAGDVNGQKKKVSAQFLKKRQKRESVHLRLRTKHTLTE